MREEVRDVERLSHMLEAINVLAHRGTPCELIVSAGESDKTQHFSPPFCTFNAKTARNLQNFL